MTYRIKTRSHAPYVEMSTDPDVSEAQARSVRHEAYVNRRVVGIGMADPAGITNKWGAQRSVQSQKILISNTPFEGVPESSSFVPAAKAHAVIEDQEGHLFGLSDCKPQRREDPRYGTLIMDAHRRGWFVPADEAAEPEPIMLSVPPHVREFDLLGLDLVDVLPCSVMATVEFQVVKGMTKAPRTSFEEARQRVDAKVAREDLIAKIVADVVTPEAFSALLDTMTFPTSKGLFPDHSSREREAFDDALADIARRALIRLRDAGLCAPCPNNGPRGVREMDLWDTFLTGVADVEPERGAPFSHMTAYNWAMTMPAFRAFQSVLIMASVDAENLAWAEKNEGTRRPHDARIPFTRAEAERVYAPFLDEILNVMRGEQSPISLVDGMESRNDRVRLGLVSSFLTPVLCEFLDRRRTPLPLPVMEMPKMVRHLSLTLPTGRLVMADWFRMPGFSKAMETLSEEEEAGFDINKAQGLDARMRAYYEKAGVVIVQVGNSSPYAYADGEGIWRMGHVDEDCDTFWDEDGNSLRAIPQPLWTTCTDLWANTFASPEAIVNVLMSSGEYADEAEAERALLEYCEGTYGANVIDLGVETLHVYAPTGFACYQTDNMSGVGAEQISQDEWREDAYILSDRELFVDPKKLATDAWTEFRSAEAETIPSP